MVISGQSQWSHILGVGLWQPTCWECRFESHQWHGRLALVCCEVFVSGWSLVCSSPTEHGVSECDHEALILRSPWGAKGCCTMGRKKEVICDYTPLIYQSWLIKILWDLQMFCINIKYRCSFPIFCKTELNNTGHVCTWGIMNIYSIFKFLNTVTCYVHFKMTKECKTWNVV